MTHTTPKESLEHTPISLPQSRQGWGLLLGGALILVGGTWAIFHATHVPQPEETASAPAIAVQTLTVQTQSIANRLELSGTIQPLEQAVLSTRVTGRITQLGLEAGDRFQKGDVLARIDVLDMAAQTNQAQSGVTQAQAELARSQATLSQLQSQRLEAQATLKLAQVNQRRMTQLQAEGAVSQAQLDEADTRLDEANARVAQVTAGIQQAQAAIDQAQAAVSQAKSGVVAASASESYGNVTAPFTGVVVQKLAYEGEIAAPGTALLKIENPDRLQLEIAVPEENLKLMRVGQAVPVHVDAINQTFNAVIQQIVPAADPTSRSFLVKIPLRHSDLISGMFGRITLAQGKQDGIKIPESTLIQRGQLQGVYVLENMTHPIAVLRWIKTGKTDNGQVEVVSGLTAGDRIITSPIDQLSDGQTVEVAQ